MEDGDPGGDWFTVRRIDGSTWAIGEYGHPEGVNSYLVEGEERAVVLDTGTGIGDFEGVVRGLTDRPILVVTSHAHWDHVGSHGRFEEVTIHEKERSWLAAGAPGFPPEAVRAELTRDLSKPLPDGFDLDSYELYTGEPTRTLEDGETIDLGDRRLRVLHTPGHSPGHCCLHEPDRGYLFAGDLVYRGPLYAHLDGSDPGAFAESIRRVDGLDAVSSVLAGHDEPEVDPELLSAIGEAVDELDEAGLVRPGSGTHRFDGFEIHF